MRPEDAPHWIIWAFYVTTTEPSTPTAPAGGSSSRPPGVFRWTSLAGRTYLTDTTTNDEEALLPWEQPRSAGTAAADHATSPVDSARRPTTDPRNNGHRSTGPRPAADPCPF